MSPSQGTKSSDMWQNKVFGYRLSKSDNDDWDI